VNLDNDFLKRFESELLFETVIDDIELFIFDNKINYSRVPPFVRLTLSAAKELRLAIIEFYDGREVDFCNIIEFKSTADIDPDAREWGAKRSGGITSVSDAMIIGGTAQKMLANFYLKINRPKKPTKFFNNIEDSISWSLEQLER
jgi:hypothetical protein